MRQKSRRRRCAALLFGALGGLGCTRNGAPISPAPLTPSGPPPVLAASAELPPPGEPSELAPIVEPVGLGLWWQPRPVLNVEPLSAAEQQGAQVCVQDHRVNDPQIDAPRALAAAQCFADVRSYGLEMQLLQVVIVRFPGAAEVKFALERKGLRFEQLDRREKAMAAYMMYLRLYPKDALAREYGQRAVCLARSVRYEHKVAQLLSTLERFYAKAGFVRPELSELDYLCGGLGPDEADH